MRSLILLSFATFTLIAGCTHRHSDPLPRPLSKDRVLDYFTRVPSGTPVSRIERQIGLSPPVSHEAPGSLDPAWRFRYEQDQIIIFFDAEEHDGKFTYLAPATVVTVEEHINYLIKIGALKVKTTQTSQ